MHRYTYVHNNPVKYVDPTGRNALALGVISILVLAVLSAVILSEPPAVRNARVQSSKALIGSAVERLHVLSGMFLGAMLMSVAVALANIHLMSSSNDDAGEGSNVVPFPNTLGQSNDDDPCWKRFLVAEAFIFFNIFPDPVANEMLLEAKRLLRRCRDGEDVQFPGELRGL